MYGRSMYNGKVIRVHQRGFPERHGHDEIHPRGQDSFLDLVVPLTLCSCSNHNIICWVSPTRSSLLSLRCHINRRGIMSRKALSLKKKRKKKHHFINMRLEILLRGCKGSNWLPIEFGDKGHYCLTCRVVAENVIKKS